MFYVGQNETISTTFQDGNSIQSSNFVSRSCYETDSIRPIYSEMSWKLPPLQILMVSLSGRKILWQSSNLAATRWHCENLQSRCDLQSHLMDSCEFAKFLCPNTREFPVVAKSSQSRKRSGKSDAQQQDGDVETFQHEWVFVFLHINTTNPCGHHCCPIVLILRNSIPCRKLQQCKARLTMRPRVRQWWVFRQCLFH